MDSLRGADEALGAVVTQLVERSPLTADDIAAAVLAGIDAGDEIILPDPAARAAYELKQRDRAAYDVQMRHQAARLEQLGGPGLIDQQVPIRTTSRTRSVLGIVVTWPEDSTSGRRRGRRRCCASPTP